MRLDPFGEENAELKKYLSPVVNPARPLVSEYELAAGAGGVRDFRY